MLVGFPASLDYLLVISLFEIPRMEENMVKGYNGGNDEEKTGLDVGKGLWRYQNKLRGVEKVTVTESIPRERVWIYIWGFGLIRNYKY